MLHYLPGNILMEYGSDKGLVGDAFLKGLHADLANINIGKTDTDRSLLLGIFRRIEDHFFRVGKIPDTLELSGFECTEDERFLLVELNSLSHIVES